jgi:hypothetical protein
MQRGKSSPRLQCSGFDCAQPSHFRLPLLLGKIPKPYTMKDIPIFFNSEKTKKIEINPITQFKKIC